MSRWGNAKPYDTEATVCVYNHGPAVEFQHNGVFQTIASGANVLSAHLAERVVRRIPDVVYGAPAQEEDAPEPVVEVAAEETVEVKSDEAPIEPAVEVLDPPRKRGAVSSENGKGAE